MGRNNKKNKSGGGGGGGGGAKLAKLDNDPMSILSDLFKPMPPGRRQELNKLVERLLEVTSNFASDPLTPGALFEEHLVIAGLVSKVRGLEDCNNLNRRLLGSRGSHVPAFLDWLEKHDAKIQGVRIRDYGPQGMSVWLKGLIWRLRFACSAPGIVALTLSLITN